MSQRRSFPSGTPADDVAATTRELDESVLASLVADVGADQLVLVLELFVAELERRQAELLEAEAVVDGDAMRRAAHGIKGSASTFGAPGVASMASRLERSCKQGSPLEEIAALSRELREAMLAVTVEVRRRLGNEEVTR